MFKFTDRRKAFTLVELLLVMGIIVILSGLVLAVINPERQRARIRDAERKKDLNVLSLALEQYYANNNRYPATGFVNLGPALVTGAVTYMRSDESLVDPLAGYGYCYTTTGGNQNYVLCARLEVDNIVGNAPDGSSCNPTPATGGRYCVSNPL